jgi:membrane-associated phospholipid phosphatase
VNEPDAPMNGGAVFRQLRNTSLAQNIATNFQRWLRFVAPAPPLNFLLPPIPAICACIAALIAIVATMFVLDASGTAWARNLPQGVRDEFEKITNLGLSGWFLIPFGAILLALAAVISPALPRLSRGVLNALAARFGFLFLAIGLPGLFVTIVKRLIGRARPFVGGIDDPFHYMPFAWRPEYAALPSGHSTTAVAAAIAIGAIWPRLRWIMWIYALIIMASRVIVLAHHPSDVIAGALVGATGAFLLRRWYAGRRLLFCPGDLRPYPGPSWHRIDRAVRDAVAAPRTSP